MDPLTLSRLQFAVTAAFHFLFVPLTLGLSVLVALLPSSLDLNYSLTIFNSSFNAYTLKIMTAVAPVFVPVVIAYQIWVYRIFHDPKAYNETGGGGGAY